MAALLANLPILRLIIMFLYRLSTRRNGNPIGGEELGCVALPGASASTAIPEIMRRSVNGSRDEKRSCILVIIVSDAAV